MSYSQNNFNMCFPVYFIIFFEVFLRIFNNFCLIDIFVKIFTNIIDISVKFQYWYICVCRYFKPWLQPRDTSYSYDHKFAAIPWLGVDTSKLFNCFHILQDNYKACCVIVHDDEQLETMLTNEKSRNEGC